MGRADPPLPPPGTPVTIRPIRVGDAPALQRFYEALSIESRALRFLGSASMLDARRSAAFCDPDHAHREGFVAVVDEGTAHEDVVGHLCLEPDGEDSAELAIAVADAYQGQGIGRRLVLAAVDWAQHAGMRRLDATAFVTNARIVRLLRGLGLPVRIDWSGGSVCDLSIDVASIPRAA